MTSIDAERASGWAVLDALRMLVNLGANALKRWSRSAPDHAITRQA
jgi:hypothetical protein